MNENYNYLKSKLQPDIIYAKGNATYMAEIFYDPIINRIFEDSTAKLICNKTMSQNFHKTIAAGTEIPMISHSIWFTSKNNPREIPNQHLEIFIKTIDTLDKHHPNQWTHILWVNDKNLLPKTLQKLSTSNVEIREIQEINTEFATEFEADAYTVIKFFINTEFWGIASELARYLILYYMGGVYMDLNYKIKQSPKIIMDNYSFFTQLNEAFFSSRMPIENYIVGSQPKHPILLNTFELVMQLLDHSLNNHIKKEINIFWIFRSESTATTLISYEPFVIACTEYFINQDDIWLISPQMKFPPVSLFNICNHNEEKPHHESPEYLEQLLKQKSYYFNCRDIIPTDEQTSTAYPIGEDDKSLQKSWIN